MRVLLVSHTCISPTAGRPKAEWLARDHAIELKVLVPGRWKDYGRWSKVADSHTQAAISEGPGSDEAVHRYGSVDYVVAPVRWAWAGPAQWYMHWYPGLARLLREFQPDIIDLWEEPWGLVSAHTCWMRNRLLPSAKVISETEQNVNKKLPPPFEQFRAYSLRNAAYVVGRNSEAIQIVRGKGYRGPTSVVPNGVDEHLFLPIDKESCRKKFGFGNFTAGYVGRFVPEKGLLEFLEAVESCPTTLDAVLVGDGPMRIALSETIARKGLVDRVRIIDTLGPETLPSLMNALDVLVLPSKTTPRWKEQFGRVIIEAQACGTPVIGSDSGAIPEVIREGGLIVREGDVSALVQALCRMLDSPEERSRRGDAGRSQVLEKATWRSVASQMADIYHAVLDR